MLKVFAWCYCLGPAVVKLPLLASLRPPWTMFSLVRILLHPPSYDQSPQRASRARLEPPRLQRFLPGPPSTLFTTVPIRPVTAVPTPAPPLLGALPPDVRQKCISSKLSSDDRTPTGRGSNALNRSVTPPFGIFFFAVPRSSPAIFSFTWRLTNAPPLSEVRSLADEGRLYTKDGVKDRSITQPRIILRTLPPPGNGGIFGASYRKRPYAGLPASFH